MTSTPNVWESDEKFGALATYLPESIPLPAPPVPKLSKNALKKAAKNKNKKKKDKPQWGDGKKKTESKKKETAPKKIPFVNKTPKGDKKDTKLAPMAEAYHPTAVESAWQDWWQKEGYYSCDPATVGKEKDDKFVMVIPPPNVTGSLHLGHALTAAVEDTITRWHRMLGHSTLYVPGTDHAGIATQSVVEKMLMKEEGKTRHDLGREEFTKKVWEWKDEYGGKITGQLRSLGVSVDWGRERFTMDDKCSRAVVEAFNVLHERGLLYRERRMGNWSCALKSAISDIEVDSIELEGRTFLEVKTHKGNPKDKLGRYEFGTLTSFSYPIEGGKDGEVITVATTRLETMLGDSAVAVHPDDPRYKHLHGKYLVHPLLDRRIPIITDAVLVDMNFGTGAVKITPAHDPNDYECGKRHNLEFITVLTPDGAINSMGGSKFEGMMRYDARIAVEEALDAKGLYVGKQPNKMRLGICSRSGDILEPMVTPQWYVNCQNMAERACGVVRDGSLKIVPSDHEKTWFHWLENIRDWCVSRQLWWGHRIPAWFATLEGEELDRNDMKNNDRWIVARNEEEAMKKAETLLQKPSTSITLIRDEDVLDTWFSSGLFPFSVFGWPDKTADLAAFYPTSLLETGLDILFFWVARMVMMGLELTDVLPFDTVYLHAMVRDKEGRKMSKSLGNVIDPLEVINGCTLEHLVGKLDGGNLPKKEVEKSQADQKADFPDGIPECGSDALRFGLLAYTVQGRDVSLDIKVVVGYRKFCNKLWNATRFCLQYLDDFTPTATLMADLPKSGKMAVRDKFILSRLTNTIQAVNGGFKEYRFGDAQNAAYSFWIDDLCDVYLELIKPVFYDESEGNKDARWAAQATLWLCLETGLRLLHPMIPFVTEELWQRLPGRGTLGDAETASIMIASYPESPPDDPNRNVDLEGSMTTIMKIVKACRSLRTDYNIANKKLTTFYVEVSPSIESSVKDQIDDIKTLGKAESVHLNISDPKAIPEAVAIDVVDDLTTVKMDLAGLVDYDAEIRKLEKNLGKTKPLFDSLEKKVGAEGYKTRAKEELKKKDAEKLEGLRKKVGDIEEAIGKMKKLKEIDAK